LSPESTVTSGPKLRLFVAIPLPTEVKVSLREAQAKLKTILPSGSTAWTKPDSMHLTLRFLGDVAPENLPEISRRLRESLSGFGALELICERLGCFPHPRYPRVVWAWVHDEPDERLAGLHRHVEDAVASFAEQPAEARFVGHITLARPKLIKRATAEKLRRFLDESVTTRFGTWRAEGLELIRSELSAQGSRYTTLDVFRL
jgi:2'-5' RNA ligase